MTDLPVEYADARILVVDDSEINVLLLQKMLSKGGYRNVETLTDSLQVTAHYQAKGCDLILLDIRMPGMDGYEVMEALSKIKGDDYLPILVMTADLDAEVMNRSLECGARDFLTKPSNRIETLNRVRNMLELSRLHNRLTDEVSAPKEVSGDPSRKRG
ncbi:MAG: response regulator [Alphaproteobacteria bacterium]|nr:response regulator [Alphaproteobacteria bacterium]